MILMVFEEIPTEGSELNQIFQRLDEIENQINNQQQVPELSIETGRTTLESFDAVNTGLATLFVLDPFDQEITKVLSPAGEIQAVKTNAVVTHPTDDPLNLFFIENATHDGQIKFLHPEDGKSLVLNTGGNFANGSAITINDGFFTIMLFSEENGNKWLPLQTGAGGGDNLGNHTATQDINFATFDGINIDRLIFDQAAGNAIVLTTTAITSNATGDFNTNVPTGGEYDSHIANVLKMRLSQAASVTTLDVTGVLGAQINLSETTTGKVGSILQGSSALQYTTTGTVHEFLVGVSSILTIDSGGLVMNKDIDYATFDGINIDRFLFSQTSGSSLASGSTGITSDSSGNMVFNIPNNTFYNLRSNGQSILSLDNTDANLTLSLFARDDEIPILQLTRIDSTPSVGTEIGRVSFVGVDSGGSTQEEFARITVDSEDLSVGSVSGSMHLQVDIASSTTAFLSLNNSNDNKVSFWRNIFMQAGIDIELDGNDIIFDSTGTNFINADAAGINIHSDGSGDTVGIHVDSILSIFSATGLQLGVTADLDIFTRAARITPSTATFLADGDISYNSSSNLFVFRQNGSNVNLGGSGGANTQLSNLSGTVAVNLDLDPAGDGARDIGDGGNTWKDIYALKYRIETGGTSVVNINQIISDADGMILNTPTGDDFTFNVNGSAFLIMDEGVTTFTSGTFQASADVVNLGVNSGDDINMLGETLFASTVSISNTIDFLPVIDLGSSLGDSTHSFSLGYFNEIRFNVTTKTIESSGSLDVIHSVPSGGDIIFREDLTEWFRCDGGANSVIFNRDVKLDEDLEIDGVLNHDGTTIGFYGVTPAIRGNVSSSTGASLAEVAGKINALQAALDAIGLVNIV